jgi:hypothetical protein
VSLLNIGVFSTVLLLTFLLSNSGDSAAVDIQNVPIIPAATVISDVNRVHAVVGPPCMLLLHYFCKQTRFCWNPYCAGRPVVVLVPAVAWIPAVVGSHAVAVTLAVACCWRHCCCLHPCLLAFLHLLASL